MFEIKFLRLIISIIFVATFVVFAFVFIGNKISTDTTIPVIKIEGDYLEIDSKAGELELLQGVSAFDEKDKDLTGKVFIESISKFIDKGVCKVTYAVCDSDNHVAKATRKIHYKGYVSPRFKMLRSSCYSIYDKVDVLSDIKAYDVIDGDISKNIVITSENFSGAIAGVYSMNVTVTNSNGDSSSLVLPLIFEDRNLSAPEIQLKDYLIYVKKGSEIDFEDYIVKATDSEDEDLTDDVKIESNVNLKKEGTYSVHYYATDVDGLRGHTMLSVVVE